MIERLDQKSLVNGLQIDCADIKMRHFFSVPLFFAKVAEGYQPSAGARKVAPVRARPFLVRYNETLINYINTRCSGPSGKTPARRCEAP
jgi:hypothetical protein